jgi:Glycosyltransferase 61
MLDFTEQRFQLEEALSDEDVEVKTVVFQDMSLHEQMQLATETNIFISGCGGGAVTAMFLPKGATAIIFFNEKGGQVRRKPTGLPARLDWDIFNHMSYIRVLWFPSLTMNEEHDLKSLVEVVKDTLKRQRLLPIDYDAA